MSNRAAWRAPTHPKLRRDLVARRSTGDGPKLCELRVRGAQSICLLYDFELALAAKMDGTRSLEDLVEVARRFSLPAGVPELEKFVRQLAGYGMVENADPLPSPFTEPWIDETHRTTAGSLEVPDAEESMVSVSQGVEGGMFAWLEPLGRQLRRWPKLSLAAAAVVLLGGSWGGVRAFVAARSTANVRAPTSGVLEVLKVQHGQRVRRGEQIGSIYVPEDLRNTAMYAEDQVRLLEAKIADWEARQPKAADLERARGEVEAALERALAARKRAAALPRKASRAKREAAKKAVARAQSDLQRARGALAHAENWPEQALLDEARVQLVERNQRLEQARAKLAVYELRAPIDGVVLTENPGELTSHFFMKDDPVLRLKVSD